MNIIKQIVMGAGLVLMAQNVMALPSLTGTLKMTGGFYAVDVTGNHTGDASQAVGIDFDFFGYDKFRVSLGDGDFSALTGSIGDIKDFQFDPFVGSIVDFWTIDIFSFELTDVTRISTNNPSAFLALDGTGIISAAGFEDTLASWKFSGDTSGGGVFSWSATSSASVPEPGVLALLSLGLIGLAVRKRS